MADFLAKLRTRSRSSGISAQNISRSPEARSQHCGTHSESESADFGWADSLGIFLVHQTDAGARRCRPLQACIRLQSLLEDNGDTSQLR
jgi:hypothetical protein